MAKHGLQDVNREKHVRAEAEKCVLLCCNCHAEVESGVTGLAVEYAGGFV